MKNSRCHSLISCKNLQIRIPTAVRKYASEFSKKGYHAYCNQETVSWISKVGERFILRTFAIKRYKNKPVTITECRRQVANEKPFLCHADYRWMGGWCYDHGKDWDPEAAYEYWGKNKNGGPFYGEILNKDDIMDKYFPYCAWYQSDANVNFWEYIQIYNKEPKVELLCKAGYSQLVTCIRFLNTKERSLDRILKVNQKWVGYLKGKGYRYLMACRKAYVKTEEDAEIVADTYCNKEALRILNKYAPKGMELQMCQYLHGQAFYNARFYQDYLRMRSTVGFPLHEKRYLFPDNLEMAHNDALKKVKEVKDAKMNALIQQQLEKLMEYQFTSGNLLIRPAMNCEELIEESKQMNNCVRTYTENYAEGRTAIFFIRQTSDPDNPFVTLELKNKNIRQVYAKNNRKPSEEVMNFVKTWKREYALT